MCYKYNGQCCNNEPSRPTAYFRWQKQPNLPHPACRRGTALKSRASARRTCAWPRSASSSPKRPTSSASPSRWRAPCSSTPPCGRSAASWATRGQSARRPSSGGWPRSTTRAPTTRPRPPWATWRTSRARSSASRRRTRPASTGTPHTTLAGCRTRCCIACSGDIRTARFSTSRRMAQVVLRTIQKMMQTVKPPNLSSLQLLLWRQRSGLHPEPSSKCFQAQGALLLFRCGIRLGIAGTAVRSYGPRRLRETSPWRVSWVSCESSA